MSSGCRHHRALHDQSSPSSADGNHQVDREDTHTIKEIVLKESDFPRIRPADYKVGDTSPAGVGLLYFPQILADKISATRSYKFFLSGDREAVVDPEDDGIAEVID